MIARLPFRSLVPALAVGCVAGFVSAAAPAAAEEGNSAQRFWLDVFTAPAPEARPAPTPQRQRRTTRPASPAEPVEAPEAAAEPAGPVEVTTRIVVFGDSLATNLGDGLAAVLEDQPQVEVVTRARGSSGLVRDDYYDWRAEIEPFVTGEDAFDIGVVMIGLNDRQDLVVGGERLDRLTDPWKEAYADRVDALVARFEEAGVPLVWVGLPPMSSSRLSTDLQALNEIYRSRLTRADGIFVDIWQGFVDDENRYAPNGPTLEGQIGRLRAGDGIHFTPPGARKAAHFADVEIRRIIGRGPAGVAPDLPIGPDVLADEDLDLENLTVDEIVARLTGIGLPLEEDAPEAAAPPPPVGPVLPLTGVERTPGGVLASGRPATDRATRLLNERVLADGVAPPPVPGRADDFSWPRPAAERP